MQAFEISVILFLVMFLTEYILFSLMVPFYFKNGPFSIILNYRLSKNKNDKNAHISAKNYVKKWYVKKLNNNILIALRPTRKLFYQKGIFPTQRIFLSIEKNIPNDNVRCEIRPFYSFMLLPVFMALIMFSNLIYNAPYSNAPMKLFLFFVMCFISIAVFLPFRPRNNFIKEQIDELLSDFYEKEYRSSEGQLG
ncbi:MAG: hypothetical protein KKC46_01115 [Proteobacteria bacterium]|nr:hypothetical protein [Pseudomonadota bacterium]